jgi:Stage II sporulation protein E (SpoIIE)
LEETISTLSIFRYTPRDRLPTAVFVVLSRGSWVLIWVNVGHNAPLLLCSGSTTCLEATGLLLGLFATAHEVRTNTIPSAATLLLFTDRLTHSILEENPQGRLRCALADNPGETIANLNALVDPKQNEDDITVLLVMRTGREAPQRALASVRARSESRTSHLTPNFRRTSPANLGILQQQAGTGGRYEESHTLDRRSNSVAEQLPFCTEPSVLSQIIIYI